MNSYIERIKTTVWEDGIIETLIETPCGDVKGMIRRDIINTREQHVRDALIKLGWSPPKEEQKCQMN